MRKFKWISLSITNGLTEAECIRGLLESQGITAQPFQTGTPYFPATEILVPDFQLEQAQALLRARNWNGSPEEGVRAGG